MNATLFIALLSVGQASSLTPRQMALYDAFEYRNQLLSMLADRQQEMQCRLKDDWDYDKGSPPANLIAGKWQIVTAKGTYRTTFKLTEDGKVTKSYLPKVTGTWKITRHTITIVWSDSFRDVLVLKNIKTWPHALRIVYAPKEFDPDPAKFWAIKVPQRNSTPSAAEFGQPRPTVR